MAILNWVISFLSCVVICLLCLSGCSESAGVKSNMDSVLNNSDLEFQRQANQPPSAKTLYAMAEILAAQGRDSQCEFVLRRIIREHPQFTQAYNSLAELQMRQSRLNEAIETISCGLRVHPGDPILLNNLGMCWMIRREYEKALKMFTMAAGVLPENVRYRANMAVALGLMGRDEESLSLFKQVLPEDQAKHNLKILQEAGKCAEPASQAHHRFTGSVSE